MLGKTVRALVIFLGLMTVNLSYVFGHQISIQDLMQACEQELSQDQAQGSCLRLGIFARKVKHFSLFEKIQNSCIEQVKAGLIDQADYFEPLLSYYPKCNYIYRDKLKNSDFKFKPEEEFKTLVRFLN